MIVRGVLVGALLVTLAGCGGETYNIGYTCTNPDEEHLGPDGTPDPCHYEDAPDAGGDPGCAVGDYVHWPVKWADPTLLWIGPEEQVPECPLGPPTISYTGRTDLVAPNACEACSCEPPTGSCMLPSTLTVSTTACAMPGGSSTSFNAPTPWDGYCDSTTQAPAGAAHSLTVDPLTLTENGCAPGPTVPAKVLSLRWDTFARGCDMGWPLGPTTRSVCLPGEALPAGFALCIFHEGEEDCPTEPGTAFTDRHVFYEGVEDDRQCSTCTCGAPMGSACTAMISIYKGADLTCSGPTVTQTTISSASPTCIDIQLPGQALGSKAAGPTTYLPGTCPAMGGDASGSATEIKPSTFCCRP